MNNNLPATKADPKRFITKKDLKEVVAKLVTKGELDQTEKILRAEIHLTAKEVKEEIREEIKQSEGRIINVLDSFLGEMKASQEERTISADQLSNHEDRITVLEQKAGIATL